MALSLADSLIGNNGELDPKDLAERFVRWWKHGENSVNGRCFDIGVTTRAALASYLQTGVPRGDEAASAAGNGGIMRLAPVALAAHFDPDKAASLARAQSEVTHASPECLDAAEALARILVAGISGAGKAALDAAANLTFGCRKVRAIVDGAYRDKKRGDIRSSGYVIDTLEAALWAVAGSDTFETAVLKAVNLGDDADTVGAVAGQIAGAIWGFEAIPQPWRDRLAWRAKLVDLATALMA
jgi:ADP-ribosyl-[dinitrogen reductase] hydrolase